MTIQNALVRHWMSLSPIVITPQTTVVKAQDLMTRLAIRHIPVVEGERLVGIITANDVRKAGPSDVSSLTIYELNYMLANTPVLEAMTSDPFWIGPDEPLAAAAQLMLDHKIGGLPVVEDEQLVGMLTESDLFRAVIDYFDANK